MEVPTPDPRPPQRISGPVWDSCASGVHTLLVPSPVVRGSFGWFDRGALDKRGARADGVHWRTGAQESAGGGPSVKV